jgi:hypothetical protein
MAKATNSSGCRKGRDSPCLSRTHELHQQLGSRRFLRSRDRWLSHLTQRDEADRTIGEIEIALGAADRDHRNVPYEIRKELRAHAAHRRAPAWRRERSDAQGRWLDAPRGREARRERVARVSLEARRDDAEDRASLFDRTVSGIGAKELPRGHGALGDDFAATFTSIVNVTPLKLCATLNIPCQS